MATGRIIHSAIHRLTVPLNSMLSGERFLHLHHISTSAPPLLHVLPTRHATTSVSAPQASPASSVCKVDSPCQPLTIATLMYTPSPVKTIQDVLCRRLALSSTEAAAACRRHRQLRQIGPAMLQVHISFLLAHGVAAADLAHDIDVLCVPLSHAAYIMGSLERVAPLASLAQLYPLCCLAQSAAKRMTADLRQNGTSSLLHRTAHTLGVSLLQSARLLCRCGGLFRLADSAERDRRLALLTALGLTASHLLASPQLLRLSSLQLLIYRQQLACRQCAPSDGHSSWLVAAELLKRYRLNSSAQQFLGVLQKSFTQQQQHHHQQKIVPEQQMQKQGQQQPLEQEIFLEEQWQRQLQLLTNYYQSREQQQLLANQPLPMALVFADPVQAIADRLSVQRHHIEQRFSSHVHNVSSLNADMFAVKAQLLLDTAGYTGEQLMGCFPGVFFVSVPRLRWRLQLLRQLTGDHSCHWLLKRDWVLADFVSRSLQEQRTEQQQQQPVQHSTCVAQLAHQDRSRSALVN